MLITIFFYAITIIYFPLTFWIAYRRWKKVKIGQSGISRQIIYWFIYILLSCILYALFLIIYFWTVVFSTHDWREKVYDADKWKKEPKTRVLMIDDLLKRKVLDKKSKTEVINLLGTPESNDTTYNNFINDLYRSDSLILDTDIVYELGARGGVMQPVRFLEIWFKNDTVMKYKNR